MSSDDRLRALFLAHGRRVTRAAVQGGATFLALGVLFSLIALFRGKEQAFLPFVGTIPIAACLGALAALNHWHYVCNALDGEILPCGSPPRIVRDAYAAATFGSIVDRVGNWLPSLIAFYMDGEGKQQRSKVFADEVAVEQDGRAFYLVGKVFGVETTYLICERRNARLR